MGDLSFGPFELDSAASRLLRDGIEVKMRPQAFAALRTLVSHPGRFLSYDQFIEEAWVGTAVSRHTVNVTIGEVRRCLGDCGSWIVWRPKVGYCLRIPQSETLVRMGWHFANLRSSEAFERALECFDGAAVEAPHDPRPFEGQAACYLMMASFGTRPGREMFQAFLKAHERAVSLAGPTPEICCNHAHAIHIYQRRLDEALAEFDRVIAEKPELAIAHVRRALVLVTMGDLDAALDSAARGRAAEPLLPLTATAEVNVRIWRREFEDAVTLGERAVQLHPYFMLTRVYYAMALECAGRLDAALQQYYIGGVITEGLAWMRGLEGACLAKLGRTADARAILGELLDRRNREYVEAYALARLHLALGDLDSAFVELERAVDESVSGLYALRFDPTADGFRSDPRFGQLLHRYLAPISAGTAIFAHVFNVLTHF
jgi:DNA-binding winged helix-turn-helix (wHTH) protein